LAADVLPATRAPTPTRQSAPLIVIGAIALAALLSLAFAPRAEALIYWSNFGDTTIGRANLDGTGVDKTFIDPNGSPTGLAVDEAHVYWASPFGGADLIDSIGRANLDGTGVDHNFIAGANLPTAVAVDDAHVYWANWGTDSIGRANLDGTGVDQGLIPAGGPFGVAVDATHVYFDSGRDSIGRANLDGTGVDPSFIAAASFPQGVAVDDAHVYWTTGRDSIGRANLDGTGVDPSFIAGVSAGNVAVDAAHVTGPAASPTRSGAPIWTALASTRASSPARAILGGSRWIRSPSSASAR
jgi:virginiamycin B lyase